MIYCWKGNSSKNKVKGALIFLYNVFKTIILMKNTSCDICHAYYATNILSILAAIFLRKPLVVIVMGGDVIFEQHDHLPWYIKKLSMYTLQKAESVICKSPYLRERVINLGVQKKKVQVCLFGVVVAFLFVKKKKKSHSTFIFLSTRPLKNFYNQAKVIEVIHKLNDIGIKAKLRIFILNPDIEYLKKLQVMIKEINLHHMVEFLTPLKKPEFLIKFYKESHFVIALPDSDGIPQSSLEGMALGCINILPKCISYKNVFDKSNSILVSGSIMEIALTIKSSIEHLDNIRTNAFNFVKKKGMLTNNIISLSRSFESLQYQNNFYLSNKILVVFIIYIFDQFLFMGIRNKFKKSVSRICAEYFFL